jgi:hypothetical protein
MALREITQDEITQHLVNLIELNEDAMRIRWQPFDQETDGTGKHLKIFPNLQEQLIYTPAVEIIERDSRNTIFSVGSQEQLINVSLIITTTNNHPIESRKYCRIISSTIFELLNDFKNRAFKPTGKDFCIYYSEASDIVWGFRRGKGLYSAEIKWMCKLFKPNRYGLPGESVVNCS